MSKEEPKDRKSEMTNTRVERAVETSKATALDSNLPVSEGETVPDDEWRASAAEAQEAEENAPVEEPPKRHADIGLWEAVKWKGRPMWRHKRTGQTLYKHDEVKRLRNQK